MDKVSRLRDRYVPLDDTEREPVHLPHSDLTGRLAKKGCSRRAWPVYPYNRRGRPARNNNKKESKIGLGIFISSMVRDQHP
jgi:hypothetical protein